MTSTDRPIAVLRPDQAEAAQEGIDLVREATVFLRTQHGYKRTPAGRELLSMLNDAQVKFNESGLMSRPRAKRKVVH